MSSHSTSVSSALHEIVSGDILKSLKSAFVVDDCRLATKVNGVKEPKQSVKLVFSNSISPIHVRLGYAQFKVEPYVPLVFQCFCCRRFGHY